MRWSFERGLGWAQCPVGALGVGAEALARGVSVVGGQTAPSRRRGKFRTLVNDCDTALRELGTAMPLSGIEWLLADRITAVAAALEVTEKTALGRYFDRSWGRGTARLLVADHVDGGGLGPGAAAARAERVPVARLLTVLAGLGQAQVYAAVNAPPAAGGPDPPGATTAAVASYDPGAAGEAVTALAIAVYTAGPVAGEAKIEPRYLAQAYRALAAFAELLAHRRWVTCRCPQPCGWEGLAAGLVERVRTDRDSLLPYLTPDHTSPRRAGATPDLPADPTRHATPQPAHTTPAAVVPLAGRGRRRPPP